MIRQIKRVNVIITPFGAVFSVKNDNAGEDRSRYARIQREQAAVVWVQRPVPAFCMGVRIT